MAATRLDQPSLAVLSQMVAGTNPHVKGLVKRRNFLQPPPLQVDIDNP
jgi:hypothetical protein